MGFAVVGVVCGLECWSSSGIELRCSEGGYG